MGSQLEDGREGNIEMEKGEGWQLSTLAAQAGFCQDGNGHSITGRGKALWTFAGFQFESLQHFEGSPYMYRRIKGPNSDDLAHAVASLESAEAGLATSSGMGATVAAIMGLLSAGDTILTHLDTYGGTTEFFNVDARRFGINVHFANVLDVDILKESLASLTAGGDLEDVSQKKKVMVFLETITNPIIREADVPAISAVVKKYGALLVVDHTFATPLRERPLLQGADLVVHSASKFLGGHNDLIAGVLVGPSAYVKKAARIAEGWGLCASAFDAWQAVRGIRTLQVRMERSWANAEELVKRLSASGLTLKVNSAHRCAVFSCEVYGGLDGVARALPAMHLIKLTPTLGGVTTTLSHPASSSHRNFAPIERRKSGISDGLIRISVGLEDANDLWADLQQGLMAAKSTENGLEKAISDLSM
ncbi:unnamed protein product [Calypogeia fissa]